MDQNNESEEPALQADLGNVPHFHRAECYQYTYRVVARE